MDDDLYRNAWSETTDTIPPALEDDPPPTWTSTKLTSTYAEEADLAAPSWSTGADIRWNEPGSPGFSWSQTDPDLAWGSSTYEGISFGGTATEGTPESKVDEVGSQEEAFVAPFEDVSPPSPVHAPSPPPAKPDVPEAYEDILEATLPASPDGFGSFETGLPEEALHSPGLALDAADADPWGSSAWASAEPEVSEEPVDEWERARQEKAKQDRRVPPEVLASILRQCEELGREICPDTAENTSIEDEHAWRKDRRSGMEDIQGLSALMESFLPPLTLKTPARFPQTLVAKRMATSVKLTKNLPITKGSPMSHYLSAKGSTAWETSVKEQKEIMEDDFPVGWRVVEKAPAASSMDTVKDNKPTGRLFSFWGRRQSQISPQSTVSGATESRSSSTDKPRSPIVDEAKVESRRPSQDSVRSSRTSSQPLAPSPATESSASQQTPVAFAVTVPTAAPSTSPYSSTSDPVPERSGTPPAPSAVSRFFNRFSRRSSAMGGSPRSSLALSSDDLEYLSDIVPSASDDADEDPADALEKFVNAKRDPVAPALPPPPLAPPPCVPAIKPIHAASGPSSAGAQRSMPNRDFGGLLGVLESSSTTRSSIATPSAGGQTPIPALPPPLVPSRPITPSATPGAGPSRASVVPPPTSLLSSSSRPSSRPQTSPPPVSGFGLPAPPSFRPLAPSKPSTTNSKPKLSSPFPLPERPASQTGREPLSASTTSSGTSYETAAESSPTSPTSALPLGMLYPNLATPLSPPQPSAQPMLSTETSLNRISSPSSLSTTLSSAFSPVPPPLRPPVPLGPPLQSQTATSPSMMSLTSNLFDGDDFSDFQSPLEPASRPSPPIPPPIAKSPRTLAAAMPASLRSQTAAPNMSPFTLPAPPPPSGTARAASVAPALNLASFDDDDFADFQASPSSATALKAGSLASSSSSLFPTGVSDQALLTPKKRSGFDDMGSFYSSTLPTPSPPRVPAKQTTSMPPIQPPPTSTSMPTMPSASSNSSLLSRRKSHAAEHLHTLNLMEKAAARQGRWPAPPSPLPQAIPGPPGGASKSSELNLLDEEAPLASGGLAPSFSSPALLKPARPSSGIGGNANGSQSLAGFTSSTSSNTSLSGSLLQGWDIQNNATPPATSAFGAPAKPANGGKAGGLSAQDLSFFEGF
ncbi:hypothetical protein BV20DRAFT_612792 [Pilatotrama ljubarskyi]|nr:hypothetical protein BV20DRAFT_612792 [Pilatotrama ljubarskyi]